MRTKELFENLQPSSQDEVLNYLSALPFTESTIKRVLIESNCVVIKNLEGWSLTTKSFFVFADVCKEIIEKKGIVIE